MGSVSPKSTTMLRRWSSVLEEEENAPEVFPEVASSEQFEGVGVGGLGAGVDGGDGRGGAMAGVGGRETGAAGERLDRTGCG